MPESNGTFKKYGLPWPKGTTAIAIELHCYRINHPATAGGLGSEKHFRNAWAIMWPKYEWNEWVNLMVWAWCKYKWIVVIGHQRASKCLGRDTPVLMYDGTTKMVQDVKIGDVLMGDNSTPRNVLSIARGREELFRIKSSRGSSWVCNKSHILSLKASRNYHVGRDGRKNVFSKGDVIDVSLEDFQKKGRLWRDTWKQYQVSANFPPSRNPLPVDPYCYGAWLAEGSKDGPAICSYDGPMVRKWCSYWEARGGRIKIDDIHRVPLWNVRFQIKGRGKTRRNCNPCTAFIRTSTIDGQRRILSEYMTASREERMQLLAGYIDGDGCSAKGSFSTSSVSEGLSNDVAWVARSLGFYASVKKHRTSCKSRNYFGTCWTVYISGNIQAIPTLQKKARGFQSNDPTCQSIKAESIGEGDYYGFEIDGNHRFLLGDFTVTHNTFTFGHILLLDYLAHPFETMTSVATVTFDGLRLRMWPDILRAFESSEPAKAGVDLLMIRSTTNECKIYPYESQRKDTEKYQIHGMAVSKSADSEGRIRGGHAPRRRIVLDEANDMPAPIFDAMVNPMSAPDAKCVFLTNPVDKVSRFGEWCEPEQGWGSVDENDLFWKLKIGGGQGICLHFDGLQSPNIKAGKTIFPYLLTQDSINEIISNHGPESAQYWALVRGFFPPDGMVSKIWPNSTIERAKMPIKFDFEPQMCASLDPAFEFDDCVMHIGELGMPVFGQKDYKINGKETMVAKLDSGLTAEPKDYQVAHWVMYECEKRNILPKHFIMDITGNGRGVFAILQKEWSRDVQGIEYGGKATDRPLRGDDSRKCEDMYERFITELYFRASECAKTGLIGGLSNLDRRTIDDLSARRYILKQGSKGTLMVAETKKDVKKRLGRSPDYGDPFVQFGELLIRLGTAPGGGMAARIAQAQKTGSMWDRSKAKAKRAAGVYSEEREFAHF